MNGLYDIFNEFNEQFEPEQQSKTNILIYGWFCAFHNMIQERLTDDLVTDFRIALQTRIDRYRKLTESRVFNLDEYDKQLIEIMDELYQEHTTMDNIKLDEFPKVKNGPNKENLKGLLIDISAYRGAFFPLASQIEQYLLKEGRNELGMQHKAAAAEMNLCQSSYTLLYSQIHQNDIDQRVSDVQNTVNDRIPVQDRLETAEAKTRRSLFWSRMRRRQQEGVKDERQK